MATDSELKAEKTELARKANETRNKTRLELMNEIADSADKSEIHAGEVEEGADGNLVFKNPDDNKLSEETKVEEPPQEETTTEVVAETTEEPVEEVATTVETAEEQVPPDEKVVNGTRYYLTIVNGKEKWLSKSELIQRAQKVESADEYLSNAAEAAKLALRSDPSVVDDADKVEEDDDLEKTLNSAVLGDQEAVKKVASAFSELRAELRKAQKAQPSVTPDVVKEIDNRLAFRNAVDWFNGEYSKELSDPFLRKLMYDRDAELFKETPDMPYRDRLKKAGDEVREWIRNQKGVQATPSKEKVERKKTLVNVPSAATRQTVTTEDEEEESTEDIIAQMAKGRGQARAIVHRGPLQK